MWLPKRSTARLASQLESKSALGERPRGAWRGQNLRLAAPAYESGGSRVNDSTPADFAFVPPPGTYLVDTDGNGGGRQIVPGGFDLMRSFVGVVRSPNTQAGVPTLPMILGAVAGLAAYLAVPRRVNRRL